MEIPAIAHVPKEYMQFSEHLSYTRLQHLYLVIKGIARNVYLKLEGDNPTGSMKYRTGSALLLSLERQGIVQRGSTVVESSSGNLGVALAFLCKTKGYHFIAVVDPKTTAENIAKMQQFGAQIEMVQQPDARGGYLLSRLALVQKLCRRHKDYVWTNQYSNPANPHVHYASTGPEIYKQMRGKVDAVFVPVSTGGTLAGVGRFFRENSPSTRIIGVDAHGSVIFGYPPAQRKLTGIGSSQPSSFITPDLYDVHFIVNDKEAFTACRALYHMTNICVGGSSGAVLAACARFLAEYPDMTEVVCICADKGENYASTIFNDLWMCQHGFDISHKSLELVERIEKLSY